MRNVIAIRQGQAQLVEDDSWQLLREQEAPLPTGALILPLHRWLAQPSGYHGLWLGPDDDVESLQLWLGVLPLIAVDFPSTEIEYAALTWDDPEVEMRQLSLEDVVEKLLVHAVAGDAAQ